MLRQLKIRTCVCLSVLLLSCSTDKVQTRYDKDGVTTQLPYFWRSSISDGEIGSSLYKGFIIQDKGILCMGKRKSSDQRLSRESYLLLKDFQHGNNIWIWDNFDNYKIATTLHENIVLFNDKIWIHDLNLDYCINIQTGTTEWILNKGFVSISEADALTNRLFFTANGRTASNKNELADSFYELHPDGSGYTEIATPPYSIKYINFDTSGTYVGSLKQITGCKINNSLYIVVPYVERGPHTGSSPNYNPNMTFFGLYNLIENRWVYDRVPLSLAYEGGILSLKPIVIENKVFLTSATWVYCFDVLTGEKIWEKRLTYDNSAPLDMIWADNRLVLNFFNAKLYCVDAQTGNLLWTQKSSGISSDLYHQNGVVYWIPSKNLRAVDLETGKLLWDMPSIDQVQEPGSESVWWGFVTGIPGKNEKKGKIFATSDHYLYCFEAIR